VREFALNSRQAGETSLALLEAAVLLRAWPTVEQSLLRPDLVAAAGTGPLVAGKLRVAHALWHLHAGRFRECAEALLGVPPELTDPMTAAGGGGGDELTAAGAGAAGVAAAAARRRLLPAAPTRAACWLTWRCPGPSPAQSSRRALARAWQ
jgi:hypothetical protein